MGFGERRDKLLVVHVAIWGLKWEMQPVSMSWKPWAPRLGASEYREDSLSEGDINCQ